jgi:uncharacterized protein YukE
VTGYAVDLEQLDALVGRLAAFEQALEGVRDDVESRMRRLGVVWSGRAADEHQQASITWAAGEATARSGLRELRSAVSVARANYAAALQANAAMWSP